MQFRFFGGTPAAGSAVRRMRLTPRVARGRPAGVLRRSDVVRDGVVGEP